jgi:serine/threonine protein kinase
VEEWSKVMHDPEMEDVVDTTETLPDNMERLSRLNPKQAESVFADGSQILLSVVYALQVGRLTTITHVQGLHHRQLSIVSCRPNLFSIVRQANGEYRAILNRFNPILPLPTFNTATLLKHHPNLALSSLFQRDPLDPHRSLLVDTMLRKDLRYLAPEVALSRRVSLTGDIYSMGVLAYELSTGSTIDGGPDSPEEGDVDVLIDFHRHVTMQILPPREWVEREAGIGQIQAALPPQELSDIIMRCLGKEADTRYSSLESLAYDLSTFARICKSRGDKSRFKVGEVDDLASFSLPTYPVYRDYQSDVLHNALDQVIDRNKSGHSLRIINVSGISGCGKTRIVRSFVTSIESTDTPIPVNVAWAKLEESIQSPLSSFIQIFSCLLDRFLADPNENIKEWQESIRTALGPRFQLFVSLMPTEYWRMLGVDSENRSMIESDWQTLNGSLSV